MEKMAWARMAPKWGQDDFFLLIRTLPTFWAERIWILRFCIFLLLFDPKFLDFQVPRFPNSQIEAWARPGRTWTCSTTPPLLLEGMLEGSFVRKLASTDVKGSMDGEGQNVWSRLQRVVKGSTGGQYMFWELGK